MRDHKPQYDKDGRTTKARTLFYIGAKENPGDGYSLATHIQVEVPEGLTRQQAVEFVTGKIAGEVSRYFAHECMALGWTDNATDYKAVMT